MATPLQGGPGLPLWQGTGDRGQPRATSRAGEPEQDLVPLLPRLLLIHPTALFAFFNDGKNSLAGSKAHLHLAHLQLRPKWCHLINREVLNNQMGFKTLTQANNSKICHRFQQSHSQPSCQGSFTSKFWKITTKYPKSGTEGLKHTGRWNENSNFLL